MTNKVTLSGNKSLEVEIHKEGEKPFAILSIAENKRYKDDDGNWQTSDKATFHRISLFDDYLIKKANDLKVGAFLEIEGQVIYQTRKFFDDGGKPVNVNQMSIKARKVELVTLTKKQEEQSSNKKEVDEAA